MDRFQGADPGERLAGAAAEPAAHPRLAVQQQPAGHDRRRQDRGDGHADRRQHRPPCPGLQSNNTERVTIAADKTEGTGTLTVGNTVPPGVYSIVLRGNAQFQFEKVAKGRKLNTGIVYPSQPITVTVVPTSLGAVTASGGNAKIGAGGEVTIKVTRTNGYTGEYKLKA